MSKRTSPSIVEPNNRESQDILNKSDAVYSIVGEVTDEEFLEHIRQWERAPIFLV